MIEFLMDQAKYAHWYALGMLLLAGLNIPFSEDLIMIGSAVLAATIVPDNFNYLLLFAFVGAYLSDMENYWLARIVGPKLLKIRFISRFISPEKLDLTKRFLDKYGPLTVLFGRFVPFGVRNALFTTSGLSRTVFWKFALFDFIACCMTTTVLFGLGYSFGKNYKILLAYVDRWKIYIFAAALIIVLLLIVIARMRKRRKDNSRITERDAELELPE